MLVIFVIHALDGGSSLLSPRFAVLLNVDVVIRLQGMNGLIWELDAVHLSADVCILVEAVLT